MNTADFIQKAIKIYSYKYDYSKVDYVNNRTKVLIICKKHGPFYKNPSKFLNDGQYCPLCKKEEINKINLDKFINIASEIHDNKYDYSKVNLINYTTKVKIICPEHGPFFQLPSKHIYRKQGCPKCNNFTRSNTNEFIKKAIKIHGKKYNYIDVDYISSNHKVKIICYEHGSFFQSPHGHLKGYGCPKCGNNKISDNEFIKRAKHTHNNKYDYSNIFYINNKTKIKIVCPIHGEFEQLPLNYLYNKNGCPKCETIISKGHNEIIDYIKSFNIDIIINDREIIKPQELDIFIPSKKIAIEYHGLYYHSCIDKNYHRNKFFKCDNKGIKLLQIYKNEWIDNKELIKSVIKNKIDECSNKIYARSCQVDEITSSEFNEFCYKNHIQGPLNTKIRLGLFHKHTLVQVIGFNKHNKYQYMCSRLCTKIDTVVVGGSSKLFSHFIKKYTPDSVITYADSRYSNGDVYLKLGFKFSHHTKPNYLYVKGRNIYSRIMFQKHKLKDKLINYDDKATEKENMLNHGYRIIYDAGHLCFIYINYQK